MFLSKAGELEYIKYSN